ncbi:Arabidopsis thaliana ASYNAPTIC 3, ASYNAPTIC 3 [Hibiscus trionum]|uniref:Arabidopsis thaliana ASYNAPTIC 3, ASYNAPTIC 3 n=1 Tax=Hibiscus trionum TaxID=183268 RepID=A0A9W7HDA0_HIBTR|nr:Arabidopsis thaliana ASYNAPTIC 3, ASYNAPTIC 3 [Hibiscus trionum]
MSDRRSFGSNCHPSSQSRKVSIGIILDSEAERKLGAIEEDKSKQTNTERIKPTNGISVEGKNKGEAVTASKGKQTEQVKSPWITPRSVHEKSIAPKTASFNLGRKKHKKVKDVKVVHSVQFFSNQTFNAQNVSSKQNSFDLSCKRKGRNDGNSQKVEEFNIANAGKVLESDKVVLENKADKTQNKQTETLKMKLQELLGNVSSPKSLLSSLQAQEVTDNNLKPMLSVDHMRDTVVKPRQNSDTIETDSENPDQTIMRPVTRSLTRKRAPAKVQTDNTKDGLSSKQKHRENIFSFREERSTKLDGAVNTGSKLSRKKKNEKKTSKIDQPKICFTDEERSDAIKRTTYTSEIPGPEGKTYSPGSFNEKRRENFENVQEKHSFHSPVTNKKNQFVYSDSPTSLEKGDKQEDAGNISLRNVVCTSDNFRSPTFGFKAPMFDTSPSPKPKTVGIEQGARSPVLSEREFTMGNIQGFRTFQASRLVSNKLNSQAHSPISLTILQDSDMGVEHIKRYVHSEPSSEERLSESFEDGSPTIKRYNCRTENLISPDTVVSEKPNFMESRIKRFQNHEDVSLSECSPTTTSRKGARIGESFWFQEPSEQDQADELTRAVTLFASALKTFKRKMDSTTRNKSSEILVSISEEIKPLLLNAQSEIESDVGKLISLNKSKRKRLEIGLQEQQEQLKHILEKFKEDIHRCLSDCSSILEGMEAHQIELKGIMKKQKVHQKLLMHVEEAAEIKLNNAERRITAVHESAREKMLQLKHVIAECLKDIIY